jgi:ATP-dependent Clp protease ATP-binding subunit ClpC
LFERFTERARQVVVLAQDEARALKHNYIGTEHILLGLLREEEGLAARVLESLDITVEEVRAQVARIVGQGDEVTTGQIPFTPRAKKVLELALREALSRGHAAIDAEHILLGLCEQNVCSLSHVARDKIRKEVIYATAFRRGRETHETRRRLDEFVRRGDPPVFVAVVRAIDAHAWKEQLTTEGPHWRLVDIRDRATPPP